MQLKLLLKTMKFFLLFVLFGLEVHASGWAQKITLSEKNASLEKIFSDIREQTGYSFAYTRSALAASHTVSIEIREANIEQVLEICLKGQPLSYKIIENTVVIRTEANAVVGPPMKVKGILRNEKNDPVEGITITVKGTKRTAVTNSSGEFEFDNLPDNAVLEFTGVSIEPFEAGVDGKSFLSLTARIKVKQMQDVAIVSNGYQNVEKRKQIGDVSVVTGEQLKDIPTTGGFDKSLSGQVAGVYVRSNSGRPGESASIQIRGTNTLSGNREPLWVLDGMPLPTGEVSPDVNQLITRGLGNIPPEDIESVTILKDATASAIYGSRAANGVIVVTTKQGRVGKSYLSYSGRYSITEKPENKFNFMNTSEKIAFEKTIYSDFHNPWGGRAVQILNNIDKGNITQAQGDDQMAELGKINTNWMDEIMQTAPSHSHVLSLSGGNDKTQFYSSLNYSRADGVLKSNNYQNAGLNIKISNYIRKNLLLRFNLYGTIKKNVEGQSAVDPFSYASFANPYEKPYNADGSYADDRTFVLTSADAGDPYSGYDHFNILNELANNTKTDNYGNLRAQLGLEFKFLNNFRATVTGAYNYSSVQSSDISAPGTYRSKVNNWMKFVFPDIYNAGIPDMYNNGSLRESSARVTDFTTRTTLEYNKNIGKNYVQVLLAHELGGNYNNQFYHMNPVYFPDAGVAGYPDMYNYFPAAKLNLAALGGTYYTEEKSSSFISSASYVYDNRYVFNGSFRSDGVSILGNKNQFAPLWSAGLQWNMHNEEFMKKVSYVDRLALRVGFGYRGSINNHGTYPFSYYNLNSSGSTYDNQLYGSDITYGNPVLKWEKKQNMDAGIEMSFLGGRINADLTYFNEKVVDLLDNTQVPASSGRVLTIENNASLSNKGFELSLRVEPVKTRDFIWEIGGNITNVKNVVLSTYYSDAPSQTEDANAKLVMGTTFVKGYAVDSWFGFKYAGVDPNNGHVLAWARRQSQSSVNGQTVLNYTDEKIDITAKSYTEMITDYRPYYLGTKQPDFYGGFNTRFTYKTWDLFVGFSFASGGTIQGFDERFNSPYSQSSDLTISRLNRLQGNSNRWRSPGDQTNIPAYYLYANAFNHVFTDYDLQSGSYLKCQSIMLTYRFPQKMMGNSGISNLKLGLGVTNAFTATSYYGSDPETQTAFGYPNTRMFSFTLEVGL